MPAAPRAPLAAAAAAAAAALCNAAAAAGFDYREFGAAYCHEKLDWGPIPERPAEATRLLQLQVFIRHGARAQASLDACWAGDQEGNYTCTLDYLENSVTDVAPMTPFFRTMYMQGRNGLPGNCLVGQLVGQGFEMEQNNGARLREAYVTRENFLPQTISDMTLEELDKHFFMRSTDIPRTKQSAMALVSGLYKAQPGQLPYVPLRTMDFTEEDMVVNTKHCPAAVWKSTAYFNGLPAAQADALKALCQQLQPSKTAPMSCFLWMQHLVDCLMSRTCSTVPFEPKNSTVPKIFFDNDAELLGKVAQVADEVQAGYFQAMTEAGAFASLASSILGPAQRAVAGAAVPKMLLFSGHDTGPMEPMYIALKLKKDAPFWPAFASMLVLELWDSPSGPLARWVSNGEVVAGPMPFADFSAQLEALVQTEAVCQSAPPPAPYRASFPWLGADSQPMLLPTVAASALFGAAAAALLLRATSRCSTKEGSLLGDA